MRQALYHQFMQTYFEIGFSSILPIRLVQDYNISIQVANRLSSAYGGRSRDVLAIAKEMQEIANQRIEIQHTGEHLGRHPSHVRREAPLDALLVPGYPYIEAEVVYAVRHEYAVHAGKS